MSQKIKRVIESAGEPSHNDLWLDPRGDAPGLKTFRGGKWVGVDNTDLQPIREDISVLQEDVNTLSASKVDKVAGKGLSTNDFTDELKTKYNNAAPSTSGTDGQVISLQSGAPTWVDPTEGSIIDTELSGDSTNPVQNKVITSAISQLGQEVNGTPSTSQLELQYDEYYIATNSAIVGQSFIMNPIASSGNGAFKLAVKAGEKYTIYGNGPTAAVSLYVLCDASNIVLSKYAGNSRSSGVTVDITESGILYINLWEYSDETDKVEKTILINGHEQRIEELEGEVEVAIPKIDGLEKYTDELETETDTKTASVSSGGRLSMFYDKVKPNMLLKWDSTNDHSIEFRVYPYIGDTQQSPQVIVEGVETEIMIPTGTTKFLFFSSTASADIEITIDIKFVGIIEKVEDESLVPVYEEIEQVRENAANPANLFDKSINLFDGEVVVGWILNGVIDSSRVNYRTTKNMISVEYGKTYYCSGINSNGERRNTGRYLTEYDANGNVISHTPFIDSSEHEITNPAVRYIRWCWNPTDDGWQSPDADMQIMIYAWSIDAEMIVSARDSGYYHYDVEYSPKGYFDYLPFLYKKKGAKIVSFGDSITDFGFYPQFACKMIGAISYNMGFGGCRMAKYNVLNYDAFSMEALAEAIIAGDFAAQHAAATALSKDDWDAKITTLESIDFSTVKAITIAYGVNDFSGGEPISVVKTALGKIIQLLKTAYPALQIIVMPPMYRRYGDNNEYDSDTYQNTQGNTLVEMLEGIEEEAKNNHIEIFELYYTLGANQYSWQYYLQDGTHPTYDGYREIGKRLGGYLLTH